MKPFKKLICTALSVVLLLPLFLIGSFAAEDFPPMEVEVKAKAAVLMDAATGTVLLAQNPHEKLYPASVTKIMTLLLVAEAIESGKIQMTDMVTVSTNASKKGGSQIWLKEGEQMSVDDLIKATAVASANDACTALGEYLAGSDEAFVKMMNERAKELSMNDTNFENCTGLDDTAENHVTSAYDIAIMSRELLKYEKILTYTTIWMDTLRGGKTELVNTNKLIRFYDGATGLKTGTTSKAGCCVSATAKRDGLHLIAVVLGSANSDDRFGGAKAMLNWGFANYAVATPQIDKSQIANVTVLGGVKSTVTPLVSAAVPILLKKGETEKLTQTVELAQDVEAPVERGQVLGRIYIRSGEQKVGEYTLTAPEEIGKLTFFTAFRRVFCVLGGQRAF